MPTQKIRNNFSRLERRMVFDYHDFIKSVWWNKQKLDWYSRHKKRCARCKSIVYIHLHHKKYPKKGRYLGLLDNAFVALCDSCHFKYHKQFGIFNNMQTTSNRFIKQLGLKRQETQEKLEYARY